MRQFDDANRVAIRLGLGYRIGTDLPGCPCAVVNDDTLTHGFCHALRDRSGNSISAATGSPGDHGRPSPDPSGSAPGGRPPARRSAEAPGGDADLECLSAGA